jgi:predicted Zn-dependent protease with MMP-like domain
MKVWILATFLVACNSVTPIMLVTDRPDDKKLVELAADEGQKLNWYAGCEWVLPRTDRVLTLRWMDNPSKDCEDDDVVGCYFGTLYDEIIFVEQQQEEIDTRLILLHEIGHALGLDHDPDPSKVMYKNHHTMNIEHARQEIVSKANIHELCRQLEVDKQKAACQVP